MSVSMCLHLDNSSGAVWLSITDGESLAWFEVRRPRNDGPEHAACADLLVNGEVWGLRIQRGFRLNILRPGGEAGPSCEELLQRFGHRIGEEVANG